VGRPADSRPINDPKSQCSHEGTKSAEEHSGNLRGLRVLARDIFLALSSLAEEKCLSWFRKTSRRIRQARAGAVTNWRWLPGKKNLGCALADGPR